MRKVFLSGVTIFAVLLVSGVFAQAQEWVKAKEADGITVYTRDAADSDIKEFRVVAVLDTTISVLASVLQDVESFPQWYANMTSSRIIERKGGDDYVYLFEVKLPFPLKPRDGVNHVYMNVNQATGKTVFTMKDVCGDLPKNKGRVRFARAQGSWTLTPLADGKVQVEHEYLADPAGAVPAWAVNVMITDGPFETIRNLREFVKRGKHQ